MFQDELTFPFDPLVSPKLTSVLDVLNSCIDTHGHNFLQFLVIDDNTSDIQVDLVVSDSTYRIHIA